MPDIHAGAGCVIGFTADLGDKVIPNIVGVDIGCGMLTIELGEIDINLTQLDEVIRQYVPSGKNTHEGRVVNNNPVQRAQPGGVEGMLADWVSPDKSKYTDQRESEFDLCWQFRRAKRVEDALMFFPTFLCTT